MTIDPLADLALRLALAAILALAALHKLRDRATFEGQLGAYALLPVALVNPASRAIPLVEAAAALLLVWRSDHAAALAAAIFAIYGGAMAINLVRGRRDIDCGCGGPDGRQTLHPALVWRNAALAAAALSGAGPAGLRALGPLDIAIAALAGLALLALYSAANALIANLPAHDRLKA